MDINKRWPRWNCSFFEGSRWRRLTLLARWLARRSHVLSNSVSTRMGDRYNGTQRTVNQWRFVGVDLNLSPTCRSNVQSLLCSDCSGSRSLNLFNRGCFMTPKGRLYTTNVPIIESDEGGRNHWQIPTDVLVRNQQVKSAVTDSSNTLIELENRFNFTRPIQRRI